MVAPFVLIKPLSVQVMTVPEGAEVDSVVAEVVEDMEAVAVDMEVVVEDMEVVADTTTTTLVVDTLEVVDIAEAAVTLVAEVTMEVAMAAILAAAAVAAVDTPVVEDMIAIKVVEMPVNGVTNKLLFEWMVFSFQLFRSPRTRKVSLVFQQRVIVWWTLGCYLFR